LEHEVGDDSVEGGVGIGEGDTGYFRYFVSFTNANEVSYCFRDYLTE
jgi:hypothetical protein